MERILLTGATGFVGGAVLRRLLAQGHQVVAMSAGKPEPTRAAGLEWLSLDLLRATAAELAALVESTGVSHCLHAAWYTHHADYLVSEINRDWLAASLRLAEGFRMGGGGRLVALGTCLEYDQSTETGQFAEDRTPIRPDTLYARCKAELFENLAEEADRDFAWARLFFVYGPGDRAGRLIPYILSTLTRGEPARPRYGGLRRDYIHVDDLAAQLCRIVASDLQGAINTGTGTAVKLADIFAAAAEVMGRPDLVELNDRLACGERACIEADMSRYRRMFGEPEVRPLRQGLGELAALP